MKQKHIIKNHVMPAQAGIRKRVGASCNPDKAQTPAFAGVTVIISFLFALLLLSSPALAEGKVLDIQRVVSAKGIEAWLVEDKSVPIIAMSFAFRGGMALDPADKQGVARLASIMMDEGAGDMDSQTFQKELSDNVIDLRFASGRDFFRGSIRTITENKDKAFSLLKLSLTSPRFDADALDRMKEANIAEIKESLSDPDWLASRIFNGMVFDGHAYAKPGYGTLPSMTRIMSNDLRSFVRGQFARNLLKISVAGDISASELATILDDTFGGLPDISLLPEVPDATLKQAGKTILYSFDVPQSFIIMGQKGIRQDSADWHAAQLVMYTLGGGGFESRLMTTIREERGLTYGISAGLSVMDHAELIQVDTSTANKTASEVINLTRQEWQKMANGEPTNQEIADAKAYLTGALPLQLTSTSAIAEVMTGLQLDKRDIDYINQRNTLLNAVTPEDAKRVAKALLKPAELTTIVVGKPEGIKQDIEIPVPPGMELPPSHD